MKASALYGPEITAFSGTSHQEFGREMAGMPSVRLYKDADIVSDREIFYVDSALGETKTSTVTTWNGRYITCPY